MRKLVEASMYETTSVRKLSGFDAAFMEASGFPVIIDHQFSFATRVRRTRCVVDNRITAENFPPVMNRRDEERVLLRLYRLGYASYTAEVKHRISDAGLMPARIEHLLAFSEIFPEVQRHCAVIALGSKIEREGNSALVPLIHETFENCHRQRSLELLPENCIWDRNCEFLAIVP